ncbi:MAG TPA: hypothetical protein VF550_12430, partial [Polyangia bacterium]
MRIASSPRAKGALVICLATSSVACTTVMYGGPKRSSDETATVVTGSDSNIERLDGRAVSGGALARYEVLPGSHLVDIARHASEYHVLPSLVQDYRPFTACFAARAGHAYEVRADQDGDRWERQIIDNSTQEDVKVACPLTQGSPPQGDETGAGAAPSSGPQTDVTDLPHGHRLEVRAPPKERNPGTGFHIGSGISFGGDDLVTAYYKNGDRNTMSAGSGLSLYIGGMVTPFWIDDFAGFGAIGSIGWKYDSVGGTNADVSFSRFPSVLALQALIRAWEHGYLTIAGGASKEFNAQIAGSGDLSGHVNLQSHL